MVYTGPVVYLVHFPVEPYMDSMLGQYNVSRVNKYSDHIKKIVQLIKFAKKHSLPIIIEVRDGRWGFNQLDLLQRFCEAYGFDKDSFNYVRESDVLSNNLNSVFERLNMTPEKIIIAGGYRERCVARSVSAMREFREDLELVLLRGDYNLSAKHTRDYNVLERFAITGTKLETGAKRKSLSKRILRPNLM
jgi:nicotinamidase-related amidase